MSETIVEATNNSKGNYKTRMTLALLLSPDGDVSNEDMDLRVEYLSERVGAFAALLVDKGLLTMEEAIEALAPEWFVAPD